MRIPLGDFGQRIPGTPSIPEGAFVNSTGPALKVLGQEIANYAENMFEAEALAQSNKALLEGKQRIQDWQNDLESRPFDEGANGELIPRYNRAISEYDKFSAGLVESLTSQATNKKAQQVIRDSLGKYAQDSIRGKVADIAQKQGRQWLAMEGETNIERAIATRNADNVDMALRVMVSTGALTPDKVIDERRKAITRIEFANNYDAINGADTKERLYEVKGRLMSYNPNLSPEDNTRLMAQVNERIDRFDKEAEAAMKKGQDEAMRELTDLSILGQLNKDILLNNSDRLSKSDRNILAGLVRQQEKEGRDDIDVVRKLQIGVLTGTVDEKQLTRVASGYNPLTGEIGDAPISPQTYRQLMSDIRTMKDENFQQGQRPFQSPDYTAAKEYLRLQVPDKKTGSGLFDAFMLSSDDSEKLSMALSTLYERAKSGKTDHLKWAQDFLPQIKAMKAPQQPKTIPQTPTSGPIVDKATGLPVTTGPKPQGDVWQIPPETQRARDDARTRILRTELSSERANLQMAKTYEERRRIMRNIEMIGKELRHMGVMP